MIHPSAAQRRLEVIADLPLLDASEDVELLAGELVARVPLPAKATTDALHIAIAAINGMDYLLTWNCTHIANAELRSRIEFVIRERGYEPPVICTPEELIEESHDQ